jgi:hypothetical protein
MDQQRLFCVLPVEFFDQVGKNDNGNSNPLELWILATSTSLPDQYRIS